MTMLIRRILPALFVGAVVAGIAVLAGATVTTQDTTETFDPDGDTTVFTVPFPFNGKDGVTVTKITEATSAEDVLTRGTDYTVTIPVGVIDGTVTTQVAVGVGFQLRIDRSTEVTQETNFRTQGSYSARRHESALDKLTMIAQEIEAAASSDTSDIDAHVGAADPHTQYCVEAGSSGGQTIYGGTGSGDGIVVASTSHATKGTITFGESDEVTIDETQGFVGIGDTTPDYELDVVGDAYVSGDAYVDGSIYGGTTAGATLGIASTDNATAGDIAICQGGAMVLECAEDEVGINTASPSSALDVIGDLEVTSSNQFGVMVDTATAANTTTILYAISATDNVGLSVFGGDSSATGAWLGVYGENHSTAADDIVASADQFSIQTIAGTTFFALDDNYAANTEHYLLGQFARWRKPVTTISTNTQLNQSTDCGRVFLCATNNIRIELPAAATANEGCEATFINSGTAGATEVYFDPAAADGIYGSCVGIDGAGAATVVESGGVVDKDWINTGATSEKGDYTKLISDGTSGWFITACVGEWASEP